MRAALDALLENAVKHTTSAQQIRVGSRVEDGALVIEVADRGNGIPASALEQVFRRFARASGEGNTRTGGVGLGLATVDAVAKAHGGRCEVSSSPAGSVFSLHLPGFEPAPTTTLERERTGGGAVARGVGGDERHPVAPGPRRTGGQGIEP